MKHLKPFILIGILLSGLFITSCKEEKKDTTPEPTPTPTPTTVTSKFSAKVEGTLFNQSLLYATVVGGSISIVASKNNSFPSIGLFFSKTIDVGTYEFEGPFGSTKGLYNVGSDVNDQYSAESNTGELKITSHDKTAKVVEGTFNFIASPNMPGPFSGTFKITEGAFTIKY